MKYRGQIDLKLKVKYQDLVENTTYFVKKIPYDVEAENRNERDFLINAIIRQTVDNLLEESELNSVDIIDRKVKHFGRLQLQNPRQIRMRNVKAPHINSYSKQDWDTQNGTCVLDYIQYRYKNVKGLIKLMKDREKLIEMIRFDDNDDIIKNGVSIEHLEKLCDELNISLYALDDFHQLISYKSSKRNNIPPLCFRVSNNHIYPIEDKQKIRSIYAKLIRNDVKSSVFKDEVQIECKEKEVEYIDDIDKAFYELINKENIIPTKIYVDNNHQVIQYEVNGIQYCTNPYHDRISKSCKMFNIPYKNQQIGSHSMELANQILIELPFSTHNYNVLKSLAEAKKNRTHHGFINNVYDLEGTDNIQAYDINKCYRNCLYNPYEQFIVLDYKSDWRPYRKMKQLKLGLYNVITNDYSLFKGSNIYSTSIIKKAIENKIKFKITHQLLAEKCCKKSFFRPFIDTIVKQFGETDFTKHLINSFTGKLGGHETKKSECAVNTDLQQVLLYVKDKTDTFVKDISPYKSFNFDSNPYFTEDNIYYLLADKWNNYTNDIDSMWRENPYHYYDNPYDVPVYFYGYDKKTYYTYTMLPIYIQMIDDANIHLYNLQQEIIKSGGTPIARKVDCVVSINSKYNPSKSALWGHHRLCEVPHIVSIQSQSHIDFKTPKWIVNEAITSSNQYQDIIEQYIDKEKSLLISGRAGTGKSYVRDKIVEAIEKNGKRVLKLAPTNVVAIAMRGRTIHSRIKISKEGKIGKEEIKRIKRQYDYIIIDEISMIDCNIWKILETIKIYAKIPFILIGDYRQLPPIEEDPIDYFNHSGTKHISDYNFIELKDIQRYDSVLAKIAEDICEGNAIDITQFKAFNDTKVNICYYNKTRKEINSKYNIPPKDDDSIFLKKLKGEKYSQDIYLYPNLPVIAYKTYREDDDVLFANGEKFIVSYFDEDNVYLYNERPDEDGNPEMYNIEVELNEFQNYFLLNYCITTHKSQGDTIDKPYNIYDWEKMDVKMRYTAITRAKSADLVGIVA